MKAYIVEVKGNEPRKMSKVLFPVLAKLEIGKAYDYNNIERNEYGKPKAIAGCHFNISHSEKYWCIVFSENICGIDIEDAEAKLRKELERKVLALNELPLEGNLLRTWVLKEAYAKYKGLGLNLDFRSFTSTDVYKRANVMDLSASDFVCYCISEKTEPVEVVASSWNGHKMDFNVKI